MRKKEIGKQNKWFSEQKSLTFNLQNNSALFRFRSSMEVRRPKYEHANICISRQVDLSNSSVLVIYINIKFEL